MVWADRIIEEIERRFAAEIGKKQPLRIRDEKTLSGRVHVGSMRGILIHGLIAQMLKQRGIANEFLFELNDQDPMDELPANLANRDEFQKYMGQPLYTVPSPVPGSKNYPSVFGDELQEVVKALHLPIHYYELAPEYKAGKFNEVIRSALDHAAEIRAIYLTVSGSKKPGDWYPLQVICEQCGKVGTTQVTGWDGKTVSYACKKDLVKWAEGCGHTGSVSPFDGKAKLPWKVEWPAKWKVFGVHIEGAGKDHSAAGGSRDIGRRISEEIFHYPEPLNIPYEFFNLAGKKMSASKGIGASAKEIADLLPPKLLKLLMIRKLPNQPIDFDPEGVTIPQLFDEYDRLADHYFKRHKEPEGDFARTYELTQIDFPKPPTDVWHMRFSLAAFLAQMPHLNPTEEAVKLKDQALTKDDTEDLTERILYAKKWIEKYAPEKFIFRLAPLTVSHQFAPDQQKALDVLQTKLSALKGWTGPQIHEVIHGVKEELKLQPQVLFQPLYQIFLNRNDGPQVGWFLSTLDRQQVLDAIASAVSSGGNTSVPSVPSVTPVPSSSSHLLQHADYGHLLPAAHGLIETHANQTKAHLIATGAAMEALAKKLGGDPATWKVAGMLHDLDWDHLEKDAEKHCGATLEQMLATIKAPQELLADIRAHYAHRYGEEYPLNTMLRKALYCVDELTGFIIAVTKVRPSKKIADVEVSSVKKKFKDKGFAAQVDREQMKKCEELLSIPLDEFIDIVLNSMKPLANQLGL